MTTNEDNKARVVNMMAHIHLGQADEFLKALFDAIVDRKKVLGDALPAQQRITRYPTEPALADWERELLEAGMAQSSVQTPPKATPRPSTSRSAAVTATATAAVKTSPRRKRSSPEVLKDRPDPNLQATGAHTIHPVKGAVDPDKHLLLDGFVYSRSDVIGSVVQVGSMYGLPDLRVKVIGVGPKAVKAAIVNQPPPGVLHGTGSRKVDLCAAWLSNTPVYFQHSILSPILAHY